VAVGGPPMLQRRSKLNFPQKESRSKFLDAHMATNANARETMLAVVSNAYGSPDVLEYKQLPKPTPLDGEVLLQVHAAGIHAGTPLIAAGIPWVMRLALGGLRAPPPDSIAGTEVAGKVVAIGSNVKTLKVGDAVFGEIVLTSRRGGFAEFVCLPETSLAIKPSNISFTKAAALPVSGQTALTAVRDAGAVKAGQKVLINGSSGGVGPYALQIAKALGAVVTAVCSTRNVEAAKALGADCVMDYATTNFTENESERKVRRCRRYRREPPALRRSQSHGTQGDVPLRRRLAIDVLVSHVHADVFQDMVEPVAPDGDQHPEQAASRRSARSC